MFFLGDCHGSRSCESPVRNTVYVCCGLSAGGGAKYMVCVYIYIYLFICLFIYLFVYLCVYIAHVYVCIVCNVY